MSWNWNSHGLPFLPGYNFQDVTKSAFHRPQTLDYKNGYSHLRRPTVGIGQSPLISAQLHLQKINELPLHDLEPSIESDYIKQTETEFIPAHVALDKKVLRFYAYFTEDVLYSPEEQCRVRPVVLDYYLEDDTGRLIEPAVENSGIPQGVRLKRQRLPKDDHGGYYIWSDLNVAMDLEVYGTKYRITHCDAFTKEFLTSEGITLNEPEPTPIDSYTEKHTKHVPCSITPSQHNRTKQFLTMDGKVLRFFALWDDLEDSLFEQALPVTVLYHLADDTVEVLEVHLPNSGRDPFPILMKRQRLPKTTRPHIGTFPSCVLELSKDEVEEYFSPKDFQLGQRVTLLGRQFLLRDCDHFTKQFYQSHFPDMEMKPVEQSMDQEKPKNKVLPVPPYNGYGSLEDSLQNCLRLVPGPPKMNAPKQLEKDLVLCYKAKLESPSSIDEDRSFHLSYFLDTDTIGIYEKSLRNTGILGGRFLKKMRVPKPGSSLDYPDFYSPADLAIGATVEVFGHRFILVDADRAVLTYLESIQSQIPAHTLHSLRRRFGLETTGTTEIPGEDAAVEPLS